MKNDWKTVRLSAAPLAAVLVLTGTALGCLRVPPSRVKHDIFDYAAAIGDSWKRMTLSNIIRIRYADAPVFMNVASVISSYSISGALNANATIPEGPPQNVFNVGAAGNWSNSPTVTYQPLTGEQFERDLLRPIPPLSILQLMIARWSVEVIFPAAVRSVNGVRNSAGLLPADPEFDELMKLLGRIQRSGAVDLRIREGGADGSDKSKGATAIMVFRGEDIDPSLREDSRRVREILKLEPDATDLEVVYGLLSENPRQLAIATRSLFEIMLEFGAGIDVPEAHLEDHRTLPLLGDQAGAVAKIEPLVHIRSGRIWPTDAYAAIRYKGYWFWIDDNDLKSKRLFLFLMILSSLAESGQPAVAPVVTIPAR